MMRNVVRTIARRDHTIGGTLLRRPFAAASSKAMPKVIDSTAVMETAATAIEAAFSAVSLAGLALANNINRSHLKMPRRTSRHLLFGSRPWTNGPHCLMRRVAAA